MPTEKANTKLGKVQKSISSKTVINNQAKVKDIKSDPEGTKYRCSTCGKNYNKQKNNFFISHSMTCEGNNGYTTVCKSCTEKYFSYLVDFFSGNEEKALDRICSFFDWYYNDEIAAASRKISSEQSRLASYVRQMNLVQNKEKGSTYLDTIRDKTKTTIDDYCDIEDAKESGEKGVTNAAVNRWGLGFSGEEYIFLDNHYKMLKSQISDDDPMQEIYIRDMCVTKVMQSRAQKDNDADKYDKFQRSYQATAKAANLKPVEKTNDIENPEESFGNYISMIEKFTPADLYRRPKLFQDIDSAGEYYKRFVMRPFKNFFTGSRDQDPEFSINLGDDDG